MQNVHAVFLHFRKSNIYLLIRYHYTGVIWKYLRTRLTTLFLYNILQKLTFFFWNSPSAYWIEYKDFKYIYRYFLLIFRLFVLFVILLPLGFMLFIKKKQSYCLFSTNRLSFIYALGINKNSLNCLLKMTENVPIIYFL